MDSDARRHDVDRELRAAFAPPPELVDRVVTNVLTPAHHVPQSAILARWRIAVVLWLALGGSAAWWQRAARPQQLPSSLTIEGGPSMLVVRDGDGRRWLIGPNAARRSAGHYVIVVPQ